MRFLAKSCPCFRQSKQLPHWFCPKAHSRRFSSGQLDPHCPGTKKLLGASLRKCHIPGPSPIFSDKARDDLAHVEKTLGFSPSSSIKRRQPLRFSPETQNLAKPCPVGERAAASHQTTTEPLRVTESTARRPCNLTGEEISPCLIPSRRFLESSTLFLLDPATSEGFGWKPTLVLVDLVSKDP
ncbi:unnamed protein product [Brassica napus]|uniref:(rape) hypothetical protein n=1 Tax=Brassica napus TaxID=3708 RepID=A0A817AV17_BRANA|nr:unnamed protein product [Brassica napus]